MKKPSLEDNILRLASRKKEATYVDLLQKHISELSEEDGLTETTSIIILANTKIGIVHSVLPATDFITIAGMLELGKLHLADVYLTGGGDEDGT